MTNRKTLIRKLAAILLPCHSAKRIYFHPDLIGGYGSSDSSDELSNASHGASMLWEAPVPLSLCDIVWLLSDAGDSAIKTRAQVLCPDNPLNPVSTSPKDQTGEDTWAHGGCFSCRTGLEQKSNLSCLSFNEPNAVSTPVNRPAVDQSSRNRISELEDELQRLREQVAKLVLIQETTNTTSMSSMNGSSSGRDTLPSEINSLPHCDTSTPTSDISVPPPPPPPGPPPPPPPPPPPVTPSNPGQSVLDLVKQRRAKHSKDDSGGKKGNTTKGPDMSEVLKGLGSVKLRAIKRSPGGTPVREKPLPCNINDPAVIIAQALKRKFAGMHTYSPDKESSPRSRHSPRSTPPKTKSRRSIMKAKHLPMTDVH